MLGPRWRRTAWSVESRALWRAVVIMVFTWKRDLFVFSVNNVLNRSLGFILVPGSGVASTASPCPSGVIRRCSCVLARGFVCDLCQGEGTR